MKKTIELMCLDELIDRMRKWMKGNRNRDDDSFNHPFAIF